MRVINIHRKIIRQPKEKISAIFDSLSTNNDQFWPREKWPPIIFKSGLTVGAIGGHGPVKYSIQKYTHGNLIEFKFIRPDGFMGTHKFEITEREKEQTEVKHTINMDISGKGVLTWYLAIKWLHNALLEDCLDKVENHFLETKMETKWSLWVIFLRRFLKKKGA
jgi:hypothetical protein